MNGSRSTSSGIGRPGLPGAGRSTLPGAARSALTVIALGCLACETRSPFGAEPVPVPVLFAPGVVSTDAREYGISFSADAREAYFTRRARRGSPGIFVSRFEEGVWGEARPLPISIESAEEPFIDRTGTRLFFSARAPVASWFDDGADNIWVATRQDGGWSEPVPLPGTVNELALRGVDASEWDPTDVERTGPVLLDGRTLLYSASVDPEWRSDLYVAYERDGLFVDTRPLSPRVNSQGDESHPAVSPDGRLLVFQGYRGADGLGEDDLYIAERFEHGFSSPRPLPAPINSPDNDGYPAFSPDGGHFFFASDRGGDNGEWSIYYVDAAALTEPEGARPES